MPAVSNSQLLVLVLVGGFFLCGGLATLRSLLAIIRGYASKHWPQTIGTIIESHVEEQVNADGQFVFFPQVRYRYVVNGTVHQSINIRFPTKGFTTRRQANILVAKYSASASIMVSYHPTKPTVSVLEPGLTGKAFMDAVFGLGFLLGSIVGCYYLFLV